MKGYFPLVEGTGRPAVFRAGFLFKLLVSVLILAALFWLLPIDVITESVRRIPVWVWPFMLVSFLVGHAMIACKWRILLAVNGVTVTWRLVARAHGMGLFANICLPSIVGGDVVRASMVVVGTKQLAEVALASLADRLLDTLALVSLSLFALFVMSESGIGSVMGSSSMLRSVLLIVGLGMVLVFGAVFVLQTVRVRSRLPTKLQKAVIKIVSAVKLMVSSPLLTTSVFLASLAVQSTFIVLNVILARTIGIEVDTIVWFYAWPLAKLCALVPISLAGIGVRDAALVAILIPYTSDPAAIVAQSLSWQAVMIGGGLLSGLAVYYTRKSGLHVGTDKS